MATRTTKQAFFVEHYLANGFNATRAALAAGYSEKTARSIGSENLTKPDIAALIEQRIADLAMPSAEVMARLAEQARGDLGDFIGLSADELKQHPKRYLLKKVKVTRRVDKDGGVIESVDLELYDAQQALSTLARVLRLDEQAGESEDRPMYITTVEVRGLPPLPDDDDGTDD